MNKQEIIQLIREKALQGGVNAGLLVAIARIESGLNPEAKAKTSSASGLFQFINSTWYDLIDLYGTKYGINTDKLTVNQVDLLKLDPTTSTEMMIELVKENTRYLVTKGITPTPANLYLAHFFGPSMACSFMHMLETVPDKPAYVIFKRESEANPGIFFNGKVPRTIKEVNSLIAEKVDKAFNNV